MKILYGMGLRGAGKTALLLGLALQWRAQGLRVSYFKPVGAGGQEGPDGDALMMRQVLGLQFSPAALNPVQAGPFYLSGLAQDNGRRERIQAALAEVGRDADVVIAAGGVTPYAGFSLGLDDVSLAALLSAVPLLVARVEDDYALDQALFLLARMREAGLKPAGLIFNNVRHPLLAKVHGVYRPLVERAGYPVAGIVPERPEVTAPTVAEFRDALGAEVLAGAESLDRVVEDVLVGAMNLEGALRYMRRSPNKAVILGGDRSDLALAALETSTSVLILTGGLYPDVRVLGRAAEQGVPVLLVGLDTYTTIEKLHAVTRRIRPEDSRAIDLARQNVQQYVDWRRILQALQ